VSSFKTMMETFKTLAKEVRSGAYFAKRGAIVWAEFPWDQCGKDRAISIQVDEGSLLRNDTQMLPCAVTMEMAAPMPDPAEIAEIDSDLEDEMIEDARWILSTILARTDDGGDPVVFKVDRDAPFVEFHDASLKVQGLVVYFKATC